MKKKIDGLKISKQLRLMIKDEVINFSKKNNFVPKLVVIIIGDDPASNSYVKAKEKASTEVGISSEIIRKDSNISEIELINIITNLNNDSSVSGVLVQLPLPRHINSTKVINAISILKDVDGFNAMNIGNLQLGNDHVPPCTPRGIITLLDEMNVDIEGKHAVIVGRSNIVGKPMMQLLLKRDATVTIVHSKTKNIQNFTKQADILIVAVGIPNMIKKEMIKDGVVIIDVGVNRKNGKLCGDVDYDNVYDKVKYITPVPKGVGPMTITTLLQNTIVCANLILKNRKGGL